MVRDEIRQVRRDLLEWALTKPDEVRFRAVIIVGNLHRLEHWPDDRLMQFQTLRDIAALERALQLSPDE
jgi:hypothetical protein